MLLDKISSKNQTASDRFYRALYSKLLVPAAMNTSKASQLFLHFTLDKIAYAYIVLYSSVVCHNMVIFRQKCLLHFFLEQWKGMLI